MTGVLVVRGVWDDERDVGGDSVGEGEGEGEGREEAGTGEGSQVGDSLWLFLFLRLFLLSTVVRGCQWKQRRERERVERVRGEGQVGE